MAENLVPIREAYYSDDDYTVDLRQLGNKIPGYASPENMFVDMKRILDICRECRIAVLTVGAFEKRVDEIQMSGALTSTSTGNKNDSKSLLPVPFPLNHLFRSADFTNNDILINFADFIDKSKDYGNMRDTEAWVRFINENLSQELTKLSNGKLSFSVVKFFVELSLPISVPLGFLLDEKLRNKLIASVSMITMFYLSSFSEYFYGLFCLLLKSYFYHDEPKVLEKISNTYDAKVQYDPVTFFTIGDLEYDRMLRVRWLLREALVTVAKPEDNNEKDFNV